MADMPYNAIFDTLSAADCNCDPRSGTCEDWPSREYRLHYLTAALWHRMNTRVPGLEPEPLVRDRPDVRAVR